MLNEYNLIVLKKNIVKYLDKSGVLPKIEEAALKYKNDLEGQMTLISHLPPLKIKIAVDFVLLAELAGEFTSLLLKEPHFAKEVLSDLVKTCCIVLAELEEITIYLVIQLTSFPDLTNSFGKTGNFKNSGLFTMHGILCELYTLEKYTQAVFYKCEYMGCDLHDKVLLESESCGSCGNKLIEVPRSRLTGERVKGLVLHPKFTDPSKNSKRTQGILIEFRDDLSMSLNIGMRYNIAVSFEGGCYLAWGVIPVLPEPLVRSLTEVPMPSFPETITSLITLLRKETHGSPWALVTGMAAHLAATLFPFSAFLHLKTALLLSLSSICSRCPVPVLALGDCEILMSEICEYSPRAILAPKGPSSLLLATHGVCYLQENINLSYINTAIESELVTLKTDKSSKDNKYCTYPLRTAVWVSWQCNKHSSQDIHKLKTLIETFGIPFLEEVELNDEDISNYLLLKAVDPSNINNSNISKEDFRKFIDVISCLHVNMSPAASALIRNYFVASRRERPECLPLKAIKVLTGLSESHARISLRDTVTFEDVVAAIFLYEESIGIVFGPSMFSRQPKRTIDSNDPVTISRQMDNVLGRFSLWLSSYTKFQISTDGHSVNSE